MGKRVFQISRSVPPDHPLISEPRLGTGISRTRIQKKSDSLQSCSPGELCIADVPLPALLSILEGVFLCTMHSLHIMKRLDGRGIGGISSKLKFEEAPNQPINLLSFFNDHFLAINVLSFIQDWYGGTLYPAFVQQI